MECRSYPLLLLIIGLYDRCINKYFDERRSLMKKVTIKVVKPASDKKNVLCCTCGIIS